MLTALTLLIGGCAFDEHLPQADISGTVVIPRAAATRDITNPNTGEVESLTDVRLIGPVWLGLFPDVVGAGELFEYPHPEMGPVYLEGIPGNTYPYGGGSVGRFDFACFESVRCMVTTGRFKDYDDILDFFSNVANRPVTDPFGVEVESAAYFQSYCYELFDYTADYELSFISCADPDDPENCGLHFEENAAGDFEADFTLWQSTYHQNMKIWGWMDAPSEYFTYSTCDEGRGNYNSEYANGFYYGANHSDLLNFPSYYITEGDYVVEQAPVIDQEDADTYRDAAPSHLVNIDYKVE
jgi:hypothetical protein